MDERDEQDQGLDSDGAIFGKPRSFTLISGSLSRMWGRVVGVMGRIRPVLEAISGVLAGR